MYRSDTASSHATHSPQLMCSPPSQNTAQEVVLVDEADRALGTMEKLQAHREGRLHRAISVLIYNSSGAMLIHRRAAGKYHSPGLWTNACCSHPYPGEAPAEAAHRRLVEEMGLATPLRPSFRFVYRAALENGLVEHEFDHVFTGTTDAEPLPAPEEVAEYRYIAPEALHDELRQRPTQFTPWFRLIVEELEGRRPR
jgi:isopentenyl-diphosphate delta-isomerase